MFAIQTFSTKENLILQIFRDYSGHLSSAEKINSIYTVLSFRMDAVTINIIRFPFVKCMNRELWTLSVWSYVSEDYFVIKTMLSRWSGSPFVPHELLRVVHWKRINGGALLTFSLIICTVVIIQTNGFVLRAKQFHYWIKVDCSKFVYNVQRFYENLKIKIDIFFVECTLELRKYKSVCNKW